MYKAPRTEENPADASAKVALLWNMLQVWREGSITPDEALRAVQFILSGAFVTPSGTRLRETHRNETLLYADQVPMQGNGPLVAGTA